MSEKTVHEGRNVKRIREMLGIKQDALAMELNLSQQSVSALEQKEKIDDNIKNFDEQAAITFVASTFQNNASIISTNCTINHNPIEKCIEALEENKKLYERLLQSEREKIIILEKMLDKK
jgi:DNA-binding XRE family transcriptional regulator